MTDLVSTARSTQSLDRPARRTQQQRRDETRAKLLEATFVSLLEGGYVATSTRRVAELAGVSTGALSHHFPSRVDMVGDAIRDLATRRIAEFGARAAAVDPGSDRRLADLLDLVWTDFQSSLFAAFVKVWVAAADDPGLHARLVPVERELARGIGEVVSGFAGDLAEDPSWERRLRAVLNAMRGLALTQGFEPRERRTRDPWPDLRESLLELLHAPTLPSIGEQAP